MVQPDTVIGVMYHLRPVGCERMKEKRKSMITQVSNKGDNKDHDNDGAPNIR